MKDRYSRQSFLGPRSEEMLGNVVVGVVGLGGGGSHIVQQLAHIGIEKFVLYDADKVEESNLNRLVGATLDDVVRAAPKTEVATRVIRGLNRDAEISAHKSRWQEAADDLQRCDVVFGCVDSFSERDQLERQCRRFVIPYLDLGMDIHAAEGDAPVMGGQIILSMPGEACMRCLGFITEKNLAEEEGRYGDAGPRPQVVWANGVLASTAVGIAIELLTNWTRRAHAPIYLEYRGNEHRIAEHPRAIYRDRAAQCPHYPPHEVGETRMHPL